MVHTKPVEINRILVDLLTMNKLYDTWHSAGSSSRRMIPGEKSSSWMRLQDGWILDTSCMARALRKLVVALSMIEKSPLSGLQPFGCGSILYI